MAVPKRQQKAKAKGRKRPRIKYARDVNKAPSIRTRRGQAVEAVTAAHLKNKLGSVLRQTLTQGVVAITRHQQTHAVLLSLEEYQTLLQFAPPPLKALEKEFDALVAHMQTQKSKRAARSPSRATPSDLARAARKFRQSEQSTQPHRSKKRRKGQRHGR